MEENNKEPVAEANKTAPKKGLFKRVKEVSWKKKILFGLIAAVFLGISIQVAGYLVGLSYSRYEYNANRAHVRPVVSGSVSEPSISGVSDGGIFPSSISVSFQKPVANMELADKDVTDKVKIFPTISGHWTWNGEYRLVFAPDSDWAPDTTYTINLSSSLFNEKAYQVKQLEYKIKTQPFTGRFTQTEFYEDPITPKIKRVTATLSFTHPVDLESLQQNLKAALLNGEAYGFTVTPANSNRLFYVVTDPVKIKAEENFLTLSLENVKNLYNNKGLKETVSAKIKIPSASTFFKINNIYSNIVLNQEKENTAEQVFFVDFSSTVTSEALAPYLKLFQYPSSCYSFNEAYRSQTGKDFSLSFVKQLNSKEKYSDRLKKVIPLDFTPVPLESPASKMHMFKYEVKNPRNVCVIAEFSRGLSSLDEFMLHETQVRTVEASKFPTDLKIAFDGAILSLTGEKSLPLVTRGIAQAEAEVARIPAESINHLISQTYGTFKQPSFNGYFSADNISERFQETLPLNTNSPEKPNYSTLNLNKFFESRKGIFIATVKGKRIGENYTSVSDERLILVTDLGIIVKDNKDDTHSVFISNFVSGAPVSKAKVDVLAKNGIPVLSAYTNREGMVTFPNFSNFSREKQPAAYVVTKGDDVAYMPVNSSDRRLNYSRFDVEGEYDAFDHNNLKAFVFTDRGVYRPGEEAHFGVVVKDAQLNTPVNNNLTLEVTDSYGDNVFQKSLKVSDAGLLSATFPVGKLARTGNYRVTVYSIDRYRNTIGSTNFKVEEFTPETMKIKSKIGEKLTVSGWLTAERLDATVTLENLYGAPASDHKVNAQIELVPTSFNFNRFRGYVFHDPLLDLSKRPMQVTEKLDSQTTDTNGIAKFDVDLSRYAKGTYRLVFSAEGLEAAGGRSVATQSSVLISPLHTLVGYKKDGNFNYIKKDDERSVHFIAINSDLDKVEVSDMEMEVWEKKFVSTLVRQPNSTFKYQSVEKNEMVKREDIILGKDGLTYAIDTSKPGDFYVQLVNDKKQIVSRVNYTVAGAKNLTYSLEKNAELQIKLSKNEYDHGEAIQMQITAPYEGYGLITIEKDKVYAYKWFKADTATSTQEITLPNTVEGNAYVNVAFIRDMKSKEIFMSPFSYAVKPFAINKAKRTITIDTETPALVKPGEDLVIKYKASAKSKIILYGVNEGILSYAKYTLPDPLGAFMPKKALEVSTYQIMDLILPDANLLKNRHSTGGDMEADETIGRNLNPFARKVDKPVVFWSGVLSADTEYQTYTYSVPDNFNGQIRIMAVAVNDTAFGVTQKMSYIRGDFAMTPSAPMNVIPSDEFEVGTSVANMVENSKNLDTTLTLEVGDGLEVIGDKSVTFTLDEGAEKSFKFNVKAKERLGSTTLAFVATSGGYKTKMTLPIAVRPGMQYVTDLQSAYVKKSVELKNFSLDMFNEYQTKEITASTSPLVLARGLIKYLDKYPYGCTEQTVSRAFPMLAMLFKYPDLVKDVNVYDLFDMAISTLKLRQSSNGGFTMYTSSGSGPDKFASIYAYHFLTYAKERDFDVPDVMLRKAANFMKEVASSTSEYMSDNERASYAIYVMTLNGEITTNYLINLEKHLDEKHKDWKKTLTASYVAASYKLLKNDEKANEIVGKYKLGQGTVSDSKHLYLMANHFEKEFAKIKDKGVEILLEPLKNRRFNSISSAYSILALTAYPSSQEADKQIVFSSGTPVYTDFVSVDFRSLPVSENFRMESPVPFYYTVNQQGFMRQMPLVPMKSGLDVIKEIQDGNGNKIAAAKLGEEVVITLRLRSNTKDYISDVAVVDLIPGCFEIVADSVSGDSIDSSELREDRSVMYMGLSKDMKQVSYKAKVIAKGKFILPPTYASALYDADMKAHTATDMFTVR